MDRRAVSRDGAPAGSFPSHPPCPVRRTTFGIAFVVQDLSDPSRGDRRGEVCDAASCARLRRPDAPARSRDRVSPATYAGQRDIGREVSRDTHSDGSMSTDEPLSDEPIGDYGLPTLYNLVYCSRAVAGLDEPAVERILELAQRRNPIHGITGLLVFGSGIFFQFLEGPRDHVTQLMSNIQRDTRHNTVVILSEGEEVRERLFPNWAMERVTSDDIRTVLEDALSAAEDKKSARALRRLLQHLDA
jgi:hypothetical protein